MLFLFAGGSESIELVDGLRERLVLFHHLGKFFFQCFHEGVIFDEDERLMKGAFPLPIELLA